MITKCQTQSISYQPITFPCRKQVHSIIMETARLHTLITTRAPQPVPSPLDQGQALHYLMKITQEFVVKHKSIEPFQRDMFADAAKERFLDIENHLNQYTAELKQQKAWAMKANELASLHNLMASLFAFVTGKWKEEYRKVSLAQEYTPNASPGTVTMMCRRCEEDARHKEIKEARHQIYNLRIWDPHYYFQETVVQRDPAAEESSHKKLQAKLSDLAAGAEMEQRYMREVLSEIQLREQEMEKTREEPSYKKEDYGLSVMPMLLSVYKHAKHTKKEFKNRGAQTETIKPKSTHFLASSNGTLGEEERGVSAGSDSGEGRAVRAYKVRESSLVAELNQKLHLIKQLQASLEEGEKVRDELQNQNKRLINENINLNNQNAILEARVRKESAQTPRKSRDSQLVKRPRDSSRRSTQRMSTRLKEVKQKDNQEPEDKENDPYERRTSKERLNPKEREMRKMKSHFQKKKSMNVRASHMQMNSQTSPNSPNHSGFKNSHLATPEYDNEMTSEASQTSYKQLETVYTKLGSEDSVLPTLKSPRNLTQDARPSVGFPASSPRLTSIPIINDDPSNNKRRRQPRSTIDYQMMRPKKRKEFKNIITEEESTEKKESSNANISEQLAGLMRVESKQQLLRRLFMEEMRERQERGEEVVDFDEFHKGYDNYMIKVVGVGQSETENNAGRNSNLNKKSTAHLRQILRSQIIQQHNESVHSEADPKHKQREECKQQLKDTIHEMLLAVKGQPLLQTPNSEAEKASAEPRSKLVLIGAEFKMVTQISAYLMELKVKNSNAYILVKNMLETEQRLLPNSGKPQQELRRRLAVIISGHRHCPKVEKGYCQHLASFIERVVGLLELENP